MELSVMGYLEELDIPSAKERFMENEALYKKFLFKLPENTLLNDLEQHLAEGNLEEAFRDAHTMKGMLGNLSMYKVMEAASKVTEKLRANTPPEDEEMEELRTTYKAALSVVDEIKENDIKLF